MKDGYIEGSLCEAVFFRTPVTQRLMAISRVDWFHVTAESIKDIPYAISQKKMADIDQLAGMMLLESKDEGLTWEAVRGLGHLGMMYPSAVYLNDRDVLLTYTQRVSGTDSPYPHMGVQAVLGRENEDGTFVFDFENDIIIIDDRIPDYSTEGGGFGRTNMLSDENFWHYFNKTQMFGNCANYEYFRNGSVDLQKHLIAACFAPAVKDSSVVTEVLKWNICL